MIQEFLQRKLANLLDQFIEFQKLMLLTAEGMTIKNSTIKPKFTEVLSQILKIPLDLVSGSISSLTLNKPWEKLFFFINSPIKIAIQNVHIKTKLPNHVKQQYLLKKKQNLIKVLTEGVFNPLQVIFHHNNSYINKKLKAYFLSAIVLEIKNICFQIQVDLKQKVSLLVRIESLTYRKEEKIDNQSERIHWEVRGMGVYYRASGEKEIEFISPTKIEFERSKTEKGMQKKRTSIKKLLIQKLHFNINNVNYGDIARILYLIQWHNSFDHLPYAVWKIKPFVLSQCKPKYKLIYCIHLIKNTIKQDNFRKQLILRRQYINIYQKLLMDTNSFSPQDKSRLQEIEKEMPVWKITAYRLFCINIYKNKLLSKKQKKKAQQLQPNVSEKQWGLMSIDWFKSWSATQNNKDELQQEFLKKINTIQLVPDDIQSVMYVSVDKIRLKLSIVTQFGMEPFISLVGTDCSFKKTQLLLQKAWCKVEYEKYLAHCDRYRNFISECKEHLNVSSIIQNGSNIVEQEEDQFDQIGKFLQINFHHNSKLIQVNLLPFDIFLNHEVIEKFAILLNIEKLSKLSRMDKIQQNYINKVSPWKIIEEERQKIIQLKRSQNTDSIKGSLTKKQSNSISQSVSGHQNSDKPQQIQTKILQKEIMIKTTFNLIIPLDLRVNNCPELVLQVGELILRKKGSTGNIQLKAIVVKYKMPQKQDVQEQQSFKQLVNYLAPRMEQRVIVRKFNIKMQFQKHLNFDQTFVVVDPINIELPPQQFVFSFIELVFLHIPKNNQSRVKQYYRRKQSIGQQFIDACQNLKQHITKSMIASSEKLSKKSIVRQKRTKHLKATIKGINITQKDCQLLIGQIIANYNEINLGEKYISSDNEKQIKLSVHNARRLIQTIENARLHITKQSIKRGFNAEKSKSSSSINLQISQLHFQTVVCLKHIKSNNTPQLSLQIKDFSLDKNIETGITDMRANLSLLYDEQIPNSQRFNKIPFVQPCELYYRENKEFNLNKRTIKIEQLNINIKPSLFTFISKAIKYYKIDEQTKCNVTNGTINTIQVKKSHQNYYNEIKHNQQFHTSNFYCQMLLFGTKYQLELNPHGQDIPKQKIQCIEIAQNNFLINRQISPNNFILQSNIRIVNHQDKTLWLKITQNSASFITPQYSSARQELRQLSQTPKIPVDIDLTQRVQIKDQWIRGSGFLKQKVRSAFWPQNEKLKQSSSSGKTFSVPLKPKDKVHILIDSNDHKFLQIYDQGMNFTEIGVNELFEDNEIVLKSEDEEQNNYLVIRSQITSKQGIEGLIYTFHIYSPIYIVNKTPWNLEYRLSQEQLILQEDEDSTRKIGRRRSFELIPLKKIQVLSSEKVRNIHYNQIQTMKLQLNKCQRQISRLLGLISSIKEKNNQIKDQFFKQSMLITLRDHKRQIQLILTLQFSPNILKIKIYPQFIFVNMTKEVITFKIKQDQITYPTIKISNLKIDGQQLGNSLKLPQKKQGRQRQKRQQKAQRQKKEDFMTHISQYINLSDQKLKQRDALKQLFQNFGQSLQIFTGKIQEGKQDKAKIKRKIVYNPIPNYKSSNLRILGKSSKGYRSDYNSDGQFRQQIVDFSEQELQAENIMIYSSQRYMFYKRVLKIQGYFSLILLCPTVHIINKSQAIFFAKSSCQELVKINKNSHSYIHISHESVDLQASFEEEICLNQWIKIDLNHLGTVYYSKDMIQNNASGYQSKEYTFRKKRMKKTPKIFYKILLCKYERGQKILIQQSQYPPYSFINNTNHRIKIQEPQQHFIEQFVNKGDMGEYAPKNPYHSPKFKLYIGQLYEYKKLLQFGVQKKQEYQLQKGIIVCVEQYKDKTIVQVKEIVQLNLKMSNAEIQNNLMLDQTQQTILEINKTNITVLNNWNRQLNTNYIEQITFIHQKKNYKDYYKLEISNTEGYDYMDTQPTYIYRRKKKEKIRLAILHRQKENYSPFLSSQLILNYHKNAFVVQKCEVKLDEIVFYLSADLILAYVQNYYYPLHTLVKVYHYYQGHRSHQKKSDLGSKTIIFESLNWHGTTLKIETRNLQIMQTFLNKQYQKWLVKFINWLGDIKPIIIDPLKLTYEQITIWKLRKYINLKKKASEVAQQMMDYPLGQLREIVTFFIGDQRKTFKEKWGLFSNLFKSFEYIVDFTWSLNQNLKSKLKTYNQIFSEDYKQDLNIINKMIAFKYCQWKYKKDRHPCSKLQIKIKRLQRYNTRYSILQYNNFKAKIKLAIDSHLQNKLFKRIQHLFRINNDYIFAFVLQFVVIYCMLDNSWTVMQIQSLISFHMNKENLEIHFWEEVQEKEFNDGELKKSNIRAMTFKDVELAQQSLKSIRELLQENKLTYYY